MWLALSGAGLALEKEVSLVTGQPVGELAVAGRLSIDLHAVFMVSRTYDKDTVLNWYSCGYSGGGQGGTKVGGAFGDFGFQVPFKERDARYPHAVTVDKVPVVRFDGNDVLKGNIVAEADVAGRQDWALEVWVRAAGPDAGTILGWQSKDGRSASAPLAFPKRAASGAWRHLVLNCTAESEACYLDGAKVSSARRETVIGEGQLMVLGGAAADRPSFKGDLAAVRLHDRAMTEAEIAHNFAGGAMLGTEMHSWWRTDPGTWWSQESEHFRHCVGLAEMKKWGERQRKEFDARVPQMFDMAELIYRTYSERLALRSSVVSRRPEKRGDGIKYKTPIQPADGSWMGVDDDFGWACQGAGHINPHELAHGWQAMTGGMAGNWWEAHANFPQTYNGIYQTVPIILSECSAFPASGRTYYHDRLMFEHLAQTPEYGPMFISKLWYDGPTEADKDPYPWATFARINPLPERTLADEYARMAMRNVTWDYTTFKERQPGEQGNTPYGNDGAVREENLYAAAAASMRAEIERYSRILLEPIAGEPGWWRVPKEQAPQQLGWNICPLACTAGRVSAALSGYVNPARGPDWRAAFVGVDAGGKPRYGEIFAPGTLSRFEVTRDIKELYLVVCATPTNMLNIDMVGDFRSFEQEPFPYRVRLEGCAPLDLLTPQKPTVAGAQHANGGGFVEKTAQVEASAYVGPHAQVLGHSKVLGSARVEDFAVVQDATVKDRAVVSGHARVAEASTVAEDAKVRDYAVVKGQTTVRGRAKILEHGAIFTHKTCKDQVVVKGVASVYGGNQSGSAMLDGYYAKGNEITKGKWFTWSWGQGKNVGEADEEFGGLYLRMDFERPHPWMAPDDFGVTWGWLAGGATCATEPSLVSYRSALLRAEEAAPALESGHLDDKPVAELLAGYLRPPETGDYVFWISADDEGEFWLGQAGGTTADTLLCGNPFWAGHKEFTRFPSQKSSPVRLEKGRFYPLKALHANSHMAGSLAVAWTAPGAAAPVIIGAPHLWADREGRRPGVARRIWGDVAKVADLVKRPDYPEGRVRTAGGALALNGKDQYVELQKDVADMAACTYTAAFRWDGGEEGARVFEFANPNGDALWLSPSDKGRLVFAIRKGQTLEQAAAAKPLKQGVWVTVQVSLNGPVCSVSVNGQAVAENRRMTLRPDSVRATRCYLGRGLQGRHFGGRVDQFSVRVGAGG